MNISCLDFETQWQLLQEENRRLIAKTAQLQQRLNNLASDPEMQDLFCQKDDLLKQAKECKVLIHAHQYAIDGRLRFIEQRVKALTNGRMKKHLDNFLAKSKKRLKVLIKDQESTDVIQKEMELIWQIEGPIVVVSVFLGVKNQQSQLEMTIAEGFLQNIFAKIECIDKRYQQAKKSLKDLLTQAEEQKILSHKSILEWATQSKDHLFWVIQKECSCKGEAISFYKNRWPSDNFFDVFDRCDSGFEPMPNGQRSRKRQSELPEIALSQVKTDCVRPWKLLLVSGTLDSGRSLSLKREEFLREIQSLLPNNVGGLNIGALYDRLIGLTELDLHQRQLLTKIVEDELHGWQRLRIGKYRILILIDEDCRQIKFLPCKKGHEPYSR